jgi:UPF0271 protein
LIPFRRLEMDKVNRIDLNSDVGESFGNYKLGLDEEVIPLITSANIACGFHAGDPSVMRRTIGLAMKKGVAVGAHPGLPDLIGFGRRYMDVTMGEIKDYVTYQVGALQAFAKAEGLKLQHVKPHGALYNMAVQNSDIWEAVIQVISEMNRDMILFALGGPGRKDLEAMGAHYGTRIAFEFFADRAYNHDGSLVSRQEEGAVIRDHESAAKRVLKMVTEGKVICKDGVEASVTGDTVCVHGDNPSAVMLVKKIRESLLASGVEIVPVGT